MSVKITIAKTPEQLDEIFKLRYRVFCDEGKNFSENQEQRIIDRFDTFPTTHNLIALHNNEIVGSLRVTLDSKVGVPADEFYDFRSHIDDPQARIMSCGMFCVNKQFRGAQIAMGMMLMASYFAISHNVSHVIGPINPVIANLLRRVGFEIIDEQKEDSITGLSFLPVLLATQQLNDVFVKFINRNKLQNFIGEYESVFYKAGEHIIHEGDEGQCAFVIVDGEADVIYPNSDQVANTMSPGDIFGELSLLTNEKRTANVIAKTDTQVMTLDKSIFIDYMRSNPDKAIDMMQMIGNRMRKLIHARLGD